MVRRAAGGLLGPEDHGRIEAAVRRAEKATSGEIYCVLARTSDSYFFPAAFTLTLGILGLSFVASLVLRHLWITVPDVTLVTAQIAAFACACLLLWLAPGLRQRLTMRSLLYRRAHDNASRQFLSHNIHLTEERTGVLIFVSLSERYAEIIADDGIAEKVDQAEWDDAVAGLVAAVREGRISDGFVGAIEKAGRLLALHFPPRGENPNELDDRLAEI